MKIQDLQIVDNFQEGRKSAVMRINRPISNDPSKGITGVQFSAEFDYLVSLGVTDFLITINTTGGNVFQGMEIFSTINDAPENINTETRVVGIAFSMGGVISQAGKKRTIKKHALFHAHAPRAERGKKVSSQMLTMSYNSIKAMLMSRSNLDETQANEILSKESFFEASKAAELGFFDEVLESTKEAPKIENEMSEDEIMNVFNEIENKNLVKKDMSKENEILGLTADATEANRIEKIVSIKAEAQKVESLEASIVAKDNEITQLKAQVEATQKEKAETLIQAAIDAGKVPEAQKEIWLNNALSNFEGTKQMIEGIKVVADQKTSAASITASIEENNDTKEGRKDWNFEKWSQEDPKGLEKMRVNNKAEFDKLFDAFMAED